MSHGGMSRVTEETSNWWILIRASLRVIWILLENVVGLTIYVTAIIICRPIAWFAPYLYWKLDEYMVWAGMHYVSYWMTSACGKVQVYGDDFEKYVQEPCLILVNHQSDADALILMVVTRNSAIKGKITMVLEDIFQWTHFGIMMQARGDFFIHQGREKRHLQAALIEDHIRYYENRRDPRWCVLFPEGGFLQKRKQRNMDYAKKHGYPVLQHVLLPRLGAAQALLNAMPSSDWKNHMVQNGHTFQHNSKRYFRRILDVTIAYPNGKPVTLFNMLLALSPIPHIAVHVRAKEIDESSVAEEERLRKYLYDMWSEKDQLLDRYYQTGAFPDLRFEDTLGIKYMSYVKGYGAAIPLFLFYAFCISKFLSFTWWLVPWLFSSLIRMVY